MIPIQNLINEELRKRNEERKKEQSGWYASSLGSCLRGQYFARLGEKPDTEITNRELRVFKCGNLFEDFIIDLMKKTDIEIETQTRLEVPEWNAVGRPDAIVTYQGQKKIYELKSKHSKAFWWMDKKGEGPMEQHRMQLWFYLRATGIEEGGIIYVSKDDLAILEYPVFLKDKELGKKVEQEFKLLNKAWESKDPSILPLYGDKEWQSQYCRYHSKCKNA